MNKQNQELQKTLEEYEFMPENFEIRSDRLRHVHRIEVDQYKPLFRVINFTKIADMTYLVTHYGAVSAEKIEKAVKFKNDKRLADLLLRKFRTDKYLQQYNLQEIDNVLDKMIPDPIKSRGKEMWYTVASGMISGEFQGIKLKIDKKSESLYFTDESGRRQCIEHFSIASFIEFLTIVMHTSEIFDYQTDWSERYLKRFVTNLATDERFRMNEDANDVR